ncbi:hypothetical protein [Clostridium sp. DJ247]|uniref:hypothetical protein n=1 Tax=Clostridium sp. DJ247 TaxID=2726188 RepID=UPI0016242209|nr:hypothetical protein [Clostridium sp. DJ247]MBC2580074.1 hypothetical protein [Clostridium sp. DJ247]
MAILYFWGNENDILNKQLKIIASNNKGDILEVPNLYKLTKEGHIDVSSEKNTISTAREQLSIKIPTEGLWKLSVYVENKLIGEVVVNVKTKPNDDFKTPLPL